MLKHCIYATLILLAATKNGYCSEYLENDPKQTLLMQIDASNQETQNHWQRSHELIESQTILNNRNFVDGVAGLMSISAGTGLLLTNVVALFKGHRLTKGRIFTNALLFTTGYYAMKSYNRENLALGALTKAAEADWDRELKQILLRREELVNKARQNETDMPIYESVSKKHI